MMYIVKAYTIWNTTHVWQVESKDKAQEFAFRIIREGLYYTDNDDVCLVFVPVDKVLKVKIFPVQD